MSVRPSRSYPTQLATSQAVDAGSTTVQTLNCTIPPGINRVLIVSAGKHSTNTGSIIAVTAGSNNVALTQVIADEGVNGSNRLRGESWILTDDFSTGIPSIAEVPASTSIEINITWTAPATDKTATCFTFTGVDQTTPVANTNSANEANDDDTPLTLAQDADTLSVLSCFHSAGVAQTLTVTTATTGTQSGGSLSQIDGYREDRNGAETYNCNSGANGRKVFLGINLNGD